MSKPTSRSYASRVSPVSVRASDERVPPGMRAPLGTGISSPNGQPLGQATMDNVIADCMSSNWTEWQEVVAGQRDFTTPLASDDPFLVQPQLSLLGGMPGSQDPNFATTALNGGNGTPQAPMLIFSFAVGYSHNPDRATIAGRSVPVGAFPGFPGPVIPPVPGPVPAGLPAGVFDATFEYGAGAQRAFFTYMNTHRLLVKAGLNTVAQTMLKDASVARQDLYRGAGTAGLPMQCYVEQLNDRLHDIGHPTRFIPNNTTVAANGSTVKTGPSIADVLVLSGQVPGYTGSQRRMMELTDGPWLYVPGVPFQVYIEQASSGIIQQALINDFGPPVTCGYGSEFGAPEDQQIDEPSLGPAAVVSFKSFDASISLLAYGFYLTTPCAQRYLEMWYSGYFGKKGIGGLLGKGREGYEAVMGGVALGNGLSHPRNLG